MTSPTEYKAYANDTNSELHDTLWKLDRGIPLVAPVTPPELEY